MQIEKHKGPYRSSHMNRIETKEKTWHTKQKSIGRTSQVLQKLV